jgi:hypothetical protein
MDEGFIRVRLDKGLLRKALLHARAEQRTLASLIRLLLTQYLQEKERVKR